MDAYCIKVTSKTALAARFGVSIRVFDRWLAENEAMEIHMLDAWSRADESVIETTRREAVAGSAMHSKQYFQHVSHQTHMRDIQRVEAGRPNHQSLTVNGDMNVTVNALPKPTTTAIDDYLAEHGLLRGQKLIREEEPDFTPEADKPVIVEHQHDA